MCWGRARPSMPASNTASQGFAYALPPRDGAEEHQGLARVEPMPHGIEHADRPAGEGNREKIAQELLAAAPSDIAVAVQYILTQPNRARDPATRRDRARSCRTRRRMTWLFTHDALIFTPADIVLAADSAARPERSLPKPMCWARINPGHDAWLAGPSINLAADRPMRVHWRRCDTPDVRPAYPRDPLVRRHDAYCLDALAARFRRHRRGLAASSWHAGRAEVEGDRH